MGGYWRLKQYLKLEKKFIVLGVASAWNEMKGLDDFYFLANNLGDGYQVVLLGVSDQFIESLPNNVMGLKVTNNSAELRGVYSIADVYVNLSKTESFGMTNIEAALCGTPVVSYNAGGCVESVELAEGISVSKGNVREIITIIETFQHLDIKRPQQKRLDVLSKNEMEKMYIKTIISD